MSVAFTRRSLMAAGAMLLAAGISTAAIAQDKPTLRFSAVFSDQDIRARMMEQFTEAVADDFTVEVYHGGTLFSQGTELVALQRGNLEMG
ncbi:MAG TPA: C4-dicarboxylate ABC transporter, partial [Aestuariivirgaceae bacterium]|nr:C4-dicarboxylate ABC transporter [Aestuariivirgaceae bacterium]